MAKQNPPVAAQPAIAPPVSKPATPGQSATSAAQTSSAMGGLREGRKRLDGLIPGSPEAVLADRKKDAERKQRDRNSARATVPPAPLPPLAPPGAIPPVYPSHPANPDAGGNAPVLPFESWTGEMLDPTTIQLIDIWEESRVASVEKKCIAAHLAGNTLKEISADARFPVSAKKGLVASSGQVVAEGLNALGISAKHRHFVLLGSSLTLIVKQNMKLDKRLEELIKAANASKPEIPKP